MKMILSWLILGAIAGALGRYLMPGKDSATWYWTIGLGIVGSIVGGVVAGLIPILEISYSDPISSWTIAFSTIGAVILLAGRRILLKKRQLLGTDLPPVERDPRDS